MPFTTLCVIHKNRQNLHQVLHLFPAFLPICYWSQVQRSSWVPFMQLLFHLQFPSRNNTSVMPFNPSWPRGFQDLLHLKFGKTRSEDSVPELLIMHLGHLWWLNLFVSSLGLTVILGIKHISWLVNSWLLG